MDVDLNLFCTLPISQSGIIGYESPPLAGAARIGIRELVDIRRIQQKSPLNLNPTHAADKESGTSLILLLWKCKIGEMRFSFPAHTHFQPSGYIFIISSVRSSSVHHGLIQIQRSSKGHYFKFVKFGAILPKYIHNSLSLSFSVLYTEQNKAIILHELHCIYKFFKFFRFL